MHCLVRLLYYIFYEFKPIGVVFMYYSLSFMLNSMSFGWSIPEICVPYFICIVYIV